MNLFCICALNLGLKINIWSFLTHFMQPNASLIKQTNDAQLLSGQKIFILLEELS